MTETEKQCDNISCSMKGFHIKTDRKTCLGCDRELKPAFDLSSLLGEATRSDLFKNLFGEG